MMETIGVHDRSLPRLLRHPFLGTSEWKPSGIPVAVVCDHGAVVSTGFPSPNAGRGPAAPAKVALVLPHRLLDGP